MLFRTTCPICFGSGGGLGSVTLGLDIGASLEEWKKNQMNRCTLCDGSGSVTAITKPAMPKLLHEISIDALTITYRSGKAEPPTVTESLEEYLNGYSVLDGQGNMDGLFVAKSVAVTVIRAAIKSYVEKLFSPPETPVAKIPTPTDSIAKKPG